MESSNRLLSHWALVCAALALMLGALAFSLFPTNAHAADLPDGEYAVEYQVMMAANPSQESMSNEAFQKPLHVSIAGGAYTASFDLGPKTIGSLKGYLKELYYWDGADYAEARYTDYYDIVDDYNKSSSGTAAFRYPKSVSFPLVNKQAGDTNGYVKVRVYVPVMGQFGVQEALLKIDWASLDASSTSSTRSQLTAAIASARALSNADGTYTAASYRALQDAIASAESVAADSKSADAAVQNALDELTAAQAALVTQASVDTAAADAVASKIDALPAADDLTLADEPAVAAAQSAYNALTDAQKGYVDAEVKASLDAAVSKIAGLEQAAADQKAADAVATQIDALPAIDALTLNDRAAVDAATRAYDALTDDQKALVNATKASTLRSAQQRISDLLQDATQEEKDSTAAASVTAQIQALPAADKLTLGDQADVQAARAAYDALADGAKSRVSSDDVNTLAAAEAKIEQLVDAAAMVKDAIEKLPAVDQLELTDEDAVASARSAYDALDQYQQEAVGNDALTTLQGAENRIATMKERAQKAAEKAATDQKRADAVAGIIAKLPASDLLSLSDAKDVSDARAAYDGLTESQRALAADALTTLQQAEARIAALQASQQAAESATALIRALPDAGAVTTESEAAIATARASYDGLDADARGMVLQSDYSRLTAAEAALQAAQKKASEVKKAPAAKKANPLKAKAAKKTVKRKAVKKKPQKVKIKVTGAKGKVTFSKAKKTGIYKKASVSKKGVVTFKKGAKKGTYSFKVKAAGNGSYKAKTVTIKIKVK